MTDPLLIIDLEATCSQDGSVPRREMEIIEIGAVIQSSETFCLESEFCTFAQPVRHSDLTEFCTDLTGITQEMVAAAPNFPDALSAFRRWTDQFPGALFCSWGDYDRRQFEQDCSYHDVASPFDGRHRNIKADFSLWRGTRRHYGLGSALAWLGLKFEGRPHRGIDDAKNIARVVEAMSTPLRMPRELD